MVLLEKQPAAGGSSVLSGGFMAFVGMPLQDTAGVYDDKALLLRDLRAVCGHEAKLALLEVYVREQRALYDWLVGRALNFRHLNTTPTSRSRAATRTTHRACSTRLPASVCDMGQIRGTFGTHPAYILEKHKILLVVLLVYYLNAIIVDQRDKRFVDELRSYKQLGDAGLLQSDCLAFPLFDQLVMAHSMPSVAPFDFQ